MFGFIMSQCMLGSSGVSKTINAKLELLLKHRSDQVTWGLECTGKELRGRRMEMHVSVHLHIGSHKLEAWMPFLTKGSEEGFLHPTLVNSH